MMVTGDPAFRPRTMGTCVRQWHSHVRHKEFVCDLSDAGLATVRSHPAPASRRAPMAGGHRAPNAGNRIAIRVGVDMGTRRRQPVLLPAGRVPGRRDVLPPRADVEVGVAGPDLPISRLTTGAFGSSTTGATRRSPLRSSARCESHSRERPPEGGHHDAVSPTSFTSPVVRSRARSRNTAPSRKHLRRISLQDWHRRLAPAHPGTQANHRNLTVSHQWSVAILEQLLGPKA